MALAAHLQETFHLNDTTLLGFSAQGFPLKGEWKVEDEQRQERLAPLFPEAFTVTENLKKLVRKGINVGYRRKLWLIGSGGYNLLETPIDLKNEPKKNISFGAAFDISQYLVPEHAQILNEFLLNVANTLPVQIAPFLPVTAFFLLTFLPPNEAFLCLKAMVDRSLSDDNYYFPITEASYLIEMQAFRDLVNSKAQSVVRHAEKMNVDIAYLCMSLFPMIYFPFMPLNFSLTFFDSFVFEGRKVFVRIFLQLFLSEKQKLMAAQTPSDFISMFVVALRNIAKIETMHAFLKTSFKTFLSRESHMAYFERTINTDHHGLLNPKTRDSVKAVDKLITKPATAKLATSHSSSMSLSELADEFDEFHMTDEYIQLVNKVALKSVVDDVQKQVELQSVVFGEMVPKVIDGEGINDLQFFQIREHMPSPCVGRSLKRIYTSNGDQPKTIAALIEAAKDAAFVVLLIQTASNGLGVFLDQGLHQSTKPYGTSASFVFSTNPVKVYIKRNSTNKRFANVTGNAILIGGPAAAIEIVDGFEIVKSGPCVTYHTPQLTASAEGYPIVNVELFQLI